jgi:integrase/recombinase XerD
MSEHTLKGTLKDYLALRRSLGFKLVRDGLLLEQFVAFCEQAGARRVTSERALAWVSLPAKASPSWLSMRLSVVRGFASYLQAIDPATEVPPVGWLPARRRSSPYLYSDTDIAELMAAARRLRWPLSAATYETLIGLLAVTGLRIGEAIRLSRTDVSLPIRGRTADHLGVEVRQVPDGAHPPEHRRGVAPLRSAPRRAVPSPS